MLRRILTVLISFILAFTLSACDVSRHHNNSVRIACFPNITHSQALVGMANGYFQKVIGEEYPIEWKVFNAGPSEIEALFAKEVDIGYIGPVPAINGHIKSGGELQIIAGAADEGTILLSRKGLQISNIGDLSGKRVAVPQFGNTQDLTLRKLMEENGLKDKAKGGTVEVLQVKNPEIKLLLDKEEIDAALVPEPWGSRLVLEIDANIIADYNQIWKNGKYATSVVIVRKEFLEQNPVLVERFLKAHMEITDYINKNNDESKELINREIERLTGKKLDEDVLDESFKRITLTYDPEEKSLIEFNQLMKRMEILKEDFKMDNFINLKLLNKILSQSGKTEK